MNLAEADYRDPAVAHNFYTRAIERIRALPGVVIGRHASNRLPVCRSRGQQSVSQFRARRRLRAKSQPAGRTCRDQRRLPEDDAHSDRPGPRLSFAPTSAMRRPWRSSAVMPRADTGRGENPIGQRIAFDDESERMDGSRRHCRRCEELQRRPRADRHRSICPARGGRSVP